VTIGVMCPKQLSKRMIGAARQQRKTTMAIIGTRQRCRRPRTARDTKMHRRGHHWAGSLWHCRQCNGSYRAMVVGCAVSATRNYLKLHELRRLKILSSNSHAKTLKLWKHSAMRLATSRTNAAHQFTNRPLMNSVYPPRCPLHSPGLTCMRARTSPRAGAAFTIEIATNIRSP
jgi:hypothetical protein